MKLVRGNLHLILGGKLKTLCVAHGAHFKEDFHKSLRCGYWKQLGLEKVALKYRRQIWDFMFKLPFDAVGLEHKIALVLQIYGTPIPPAIDWESVRPGYNKLTEGQRKDFQRRYCKKQLDEQAKEIRSYATIDLPSFFTEVYLGDFHIRAERAAYHGHTRRFFRTFIKRHLLGGQNGRTKEKRVS